MLLWAVALTPGHRPTPPLSPPAGDTDDGSGSSGPALLSPSATQLVATFSIVGFDPENGDLGVAVQSKFFAVGRVVPFAAAGVGAVATQSLANTTYGPRGLELLRAGHTPEEVIAELTAADGQRAQRQVGVIDASGRAATFTGDACLPWAGGRVGDHYAAQGNILAGPEVVDAMAETFESTGGDLATRLVTALAAGQAAGGDVRGKQSAALLVVREGGGYGGFDDRYIDLRVDDHAEPVEELARLLDLRHGMLAYFRATALLAQASEADPGSVSGLLRQAAAAAEEATTLNPAEGWGWMTLAEVRVAQDDLQAGAAAAIEALRHDPWIKTAILQGIAGSTSVIERLLSVEDFRRVWERTGGG